MLIFSLPFCILPLIYN